MCIRDSASTDQAARMGHDPMIGYYGGTPAGATYRLSVRGDFASAHAMACLLYTSQNTSSQTKKPL